MRVRKCVLWVLTLAIAGLIFFLSVQSVGRSSQLSAGVTDGVLDILQRPDVTEQEHLNIDKTLRDVAHVALFAVLGFLAALLARCYTQRLVGLVIPAGICALYAVFDECVQLWSARGRAFEWDDISKDCLGVVIGISVVLVGTWIVVKVRQKRGN